MIRTDFNANWQYNGQIITLPHDAMLEGGRSASSPGGSANGYFHGGEYVYEKQFDAPAEWAQKHLCLQFEGVYKNSRVWVNGKEAGGAAYGYIPFFVCLDDLLHYGDTNTIRVAADNKDLPNARWYTGGGIYRPVWLWEGDKTCIEPEGIQVNILSYAPARIEVTTALHGNTNQIPHVEIYDAENSMVASGDGSSVQLDIHKAHLWSETSPYRYRCHVTCGTDSADTLFGIRQLEWSKDGLFLNGASLLLRGGCVHHDNGILGAASYEGAEYRRVKKLKEAGYNAIRASHNPCSRAMLNACDELGVYVMDEAWDMWFYHKTQYDYASDWRENWRSDLKAMVDRDYNHPSVILYSIGNEVSEPAKDEGIQAAKDMVAYLHQLDPNRAVTGGFNLMIISSAKKGKGVYNEDGSGRKNDNDAKMKGMNSTMYNFIASMVGTGMNRAANSKAADLATAPVLNALDLCGYNYASGRYPLEGKAHPGRIIFGSETFPQDIAKNWAMVRQYPYLVGDFMWTAWDYLGEAGIGAWAYTDDGKSFNKPYPWLLADCGAFDILGIPGAPVGLAQAAWGLDKAPWLGVQPVNHPGVKPSKSTWRGSNAISSWAWQNCEGCKAVVEIYSSAPAVELLLNGKSLGKQKPKDCKATFKTRYAAGKLEAVAYGAAGNETGRTVLTSADKKHQLTIRTEQYHGLTFAEITITDAKGVLESNADELLTASVIGGELLGFGSANPRTEENYRSGQFTTYYGRALAILRGEHPSLTVQGKTLSAVTVQL